MSLPLVNETSHCRKNPSKNIPTNIENLRTADHRYKQKNTNFIWERGKSALYPRNLAGALMDKFQTKINFTLSFQYKPANARLPFYLLIFFDCLVRDLNCRPWPVTTVEQHHPVPHATYFCMAPPWIYTAERCYFHVRTPLQPTEFCFRRRSVTLSRWPAKYVCISVQFSSI
jgi:hypothetical protein